MYLRLVILSISAILAPVLNAASAVVEIPQIIYDDIENKSFGVDDRFFFTVQSRIDPTPGLRIRIFGGTKAEIMSRPHRTTADGCAIIDSSVYPLRRIDGRINLGFIFNEAWLSSDPYTGDLTETQFTAVVEQGRDRVNLIKIAPADMDAYFKYAFSFKVRPVRQVTRNEPLTVRQQQQAYEKIERAAEQQQERVATIIALPDSDVEKQCVVFRSVATSNQRTSNLGGLWARFFYHRSTRTETTAPMAVREPWLASEP